MKPEHLEVLSALFDGERVDATLLAEALADPAAADTLAEFAGLRLRVQEECGEPSDAFYARMDTLMKREGLAARLARALLPAVAASLLVASGVLGFALGGLLQQPPPLPVAAPLGPPQVRAGGTLPVASTAAPLVPAPRDIARLPSTTPPDGSGGPPSGGLRLRFRTWQDQASAARQPQ
jgi:hypothetical protein